MKETIENVAEEIFPNGVGRGNLSLLEEVRQNVEQEEKREMARSLSRSW